MTVNQAIEFVRNILDEPKYEYFGSDADLTSIFVDALREAAVVVARECWNRGEKEAIQPLWAEVTLTVDVNQVATMPNQFLFIESVRSNFQDNADKLWPHKYVSPAVFSRRRNRTPMEPQVGTQLSRSSAFYTRAEYTVVGGNILATSNAIIATPNKDIAVSYIRVPTIPTTLTNQMPMAVYIHPFICDKAAEILYRKEHPGDDRPSIGGIIDIESALYKVMRGQRQ
jgi:hypothetical protein